MTQQTFWNWFYNSGTILWARLNVLLGCIVLVITTTDMSPWLPAKYMPAWIVINSIISEYLRRMNTKTANIVVANPQGVMSNVTYLQPPNPIPKDTTLVQIKKATVTDNKYNGYSGLAVFGMLGVLIAAIMGVFALINTIFK